MDARNLLYKYKQFGEARKTAEITIKTIEERLNNVDENRWIRSNTPSNPILGAYLSEEENAEKINYLRWVIAELDRIIDTIQRAIRTLNEEERRIIELRYFDGRTVTYICMEESISDSKYHYLHRTALKAMQTVLNPLMIDDAYLDMLLFTPYGERVRALR